MAAAALTVLLASEEATERLGALLARCARPGDCILLRGHIGAGKSALARAFIRARLGPDTEVPSPTFTLVQTYQDGDVEIWHADLYRLSDPQEAVELGLIDAFSEMICLVEWPELLGEMVPETSLDIELSAKDGGHVAKLTSGAGWHDRLDGVHDLA